LLETKSLFHFQTSPPTGHNTSLDSKSYIGKNGKIDKSADFRPGSKSVTVGSQSHDLLLCPKNCTSCFYTGNIPFGSSNLIPTAKITYDNTQQGYQTSITLEDLDDNAKKYKINSS